jgi:hypothetical protein
LQRYVEDPLSEAIIRRHFGPGSVVEVFLEGDALAYRPVPVERPDDAVLVR